MRGRSGRSRLATALAIGAAAGLLSFGALSQGLFRGYRLQLIDNLFPTGTTDASVKVVAIDARSIDELGRWPWPRARHADLVRRLTDLGVKAIVLDVVFSPSASGDQALADAIEAAPPTVLATLVDYELPPGAPLRVTTAVTTPVRRLARAAAGLGHSSVTQDPADGVVRSLPLLVDTPDGDFHPSLAMAALVGAEGIDPVYTVRPNGLQVGERFIPTDRFAELTISFAPELTDAADPAAPVVSALDVLKGRVDERALRGSIAFVGVTDPTVGDDRPTPVAKSNQMAGVLIHANVLNTILTGGYLQPVGDTRTAIAAGVLAAVVAAVTLLGPVWLAPVGLLFAMAGYGLWAFVQFSSGRILDLLYPLLAVVLAFIAALGVRYFTELRGRRRVSALFSQYVPRSVAYQLLDEGRVDEAIRGERVELTVLFCDLRGFTAQSAAMEPSRVRDLINIYYDETSLLVHDHGGTLLNFVGDEVFAVWGAPLSDQQHAARAVACARAFQDANEQINVRLEQAGLPPVAYGIGVHTGEVIAAHVGTEIRRQYTVLGDTVNCGSRLCTIAGRREIVVSKETYSQLDPQPPAEVLPGVRLKGVGRELLPHRLWPDELRDTSGQVRGKVEE